MPEKSLGIVLPAYQIDPDQLNKYLERLQDQLSPEKIILEYDEPKHVEEIEGEVDIQSFDKRRGKGAAIKHGFNLLETDILVFADSDGSADPESLKKVIEPVTSGNATLTVGSRRHPDTQEVTHKTYVRRILGDILSWCARRRLETKLYDYQCGAKAIERKSWNQIEQSITKKGFGFDLQLIAESGKRKFDITEVPVKWEDTEGSTVSITTDSIKIGKTLLDIS